MFRQSWVFVFTKKHWFLVLLRMRNKLTFGLSDLYVFAVFARDKINRVRPLLTRYRILRFRDNKPQCLKRLLNNFNLVAKILFIASVSAKMYGTTVKPAVDTSVYRIVTGRKNRSACAWGHQTVRIQNGGWQFEFCDAMTQGISDQFSTVNMGSRSESYFAPSVISFPVWEVWSEGNRPSISQTCQAMFKALQGQMKMSTGIKCTLVFSFC